MTVQTLLTRLNLLGEELHQREEILVLWTQLRLDYLRDPAFNGQQFAAWAFRNVHSKTLELVTAATYAEEIDSLRSEIARRCTNVCARLKTTLGVFMFCFGTTITSSRPCLDALNSLQQSHPDVSISQLYSRFLQIPTDGPGRKGTQKDLARIRLAIQSFNPDIWNRQQPRRAESSSAMHGPAAEAGPEPQPDTAPEVLAAAPLEHETGVGLDDEVSNDEEEDDDNQGRAVSEQRCSPSMELHSPGSDIAFGHDNVDQGDISMDAAMGAYTDENQDSNDDDGEDPSMEEDEASLFEPASTPSNLHNNLSTILEESSSQFAAVDTPERARHSLPLMASPADDASPFNFQPDPEDFGTDHVFSPIRLLSDGVLTRRHRKRSFSTAGLQPKSGLHSDSAISTPPKKRLLSSPSPETERIMSTKETSKNPQRTALEPTMASLATLLPESWVNDLVIHTISRRLTSARVGVVDSLVFCANRSTRLRLRLGQVVFKDEVLIFLHEPGHWIFFRWLRASGVLEEYDSMRPASANPPGAEKVKAFLRWACDEDDMAIKLRQVKCPQQRNGSDCGIFALCFARRLLDGDEELDDIIDAEAERKYFAQCLFTSRNLSLKPSELRKIGLAVPCDRKLRARQVLYFIRRRRSYHELLRDGSAGSASTEHIGRAAAADSDSVQQAGLAAVISSLHEGHVTSLASALQTATMVAAAAAEGEHERDLRDKLQQFLNALGKDKDPLVKASSSSLHDQVLRGSLVALRENASIALSMWEARSHQPKVDAEALKRSLYDEYAMCCAFLVALEYAVCKFRRAGTQKRTETVAA